MDTYTLSGFEPLADKLGFRCQPPHGAAPETRYMSRVFFTDATGEHIIKTFSGLEKPEFVFADVDLKEGITYRAVNSLEGDPVPDSEFIFHRKEGKVVPGPVPEPAAVVTPAGGAASGNEMPIIETAPSGTATGAAEKTAAPAPEKPARVKLTIVPLAAELGFGLITDPKDHKHFLISSDEKTDNGEWKSIRPPVKFTGMAMKIEDASVLPTGRTLRISGVPISDKGEEIGDKAELEFHVAEGRAVAGPVPQPAAVAPIKVGERTSSAQTDVAALEQRLKDIEEVFAGIKPGDLSQALKDWAEVKGELEQQREAIESKASSAELTQTERNLSGLIGEVRDSIRTDGNRGADRQRLAAADEQPDSPAAMIVGLAIVMAAIALIVFILCYAWGHWSKGSGTDGTVKLDPKTLEVLYAHEDNNTMKAKLELLERRVSDAERGRDDREIISTNGSAIKGLSGNQGILINGGIQNSGIMVMIVSSSNATGVAPIALPYPRPQCVVTQTEIIREQSAPPPVSMILPPPPPVVVAPPPMPMIVTPPSVYCEPPVQYSYSLPPGYCAPSFQGGYGYGSRNYSFGSYWGGGCYRYSRH
jgi:hypothetical protein